MAEQIVIPAASSLRSARMFNYLAIAATMISASLFMLSEMLGKSPMSFAPLALSMLTVMVWVAASMFVYAAIAHHPNPLTRHYTKWAGYRYYAIIGILTVVAATNDAAHFMPWIGFWAFFLLALVPWASYDIWKAGKEDWQDIIIEAEHHD